MLGSMLGDGNLKGSSPKTAIFSEMHAEDQRGYLQWKQEIWGPEWLTPTQDFKPAAKPSHQDAYGFRTHAAEVLRPWYDLFYQTAPMVGKYRTKTFPKEVIDEVTPFALAIWYMDDGGAGHWPALSTEMKNHEVGMAILHAFGFQGTSCPGQSAHIEIRGTQQAERFLALIQPHQHPDCAYKWHPVGLGGLGQAIPEQELTALVRGGATMQDLMKQYGVGKPTLQIRLRELGLSTLLCNPGAAPDLADRVVKIPACTGHGRPRLEIPQGLLADLLGSGHSIRRMAQRLGVGEMTVKQEIERHGLTPLQGTRGGSHNSSPQITPETLQDALDRHLNLTEMSVRFGVNPATIRRLIKKHLVQKKVSRL